MFGVAAADCARSEGQSGQLQRRYRRRADELRQAPEGCGDTAKGTPVIHYLALKKSRDWDDYFARNSAWIESRKGRSKSCAFGRWGLVSLCSTFPSTTKHARAVGKPANRQNFPITRVEENKR